MSASRAWIGVALATAACGRSEDVLNAVFRDDLVGARARTLSVRLLDESSCDAVQSHLHDEPPMGAEVWKTQVPYPVRLGDDVLAAAPKGRALFVDVVALDREGDVMGRACRKITLTEGGGQTFDLELRTLPSCEAPPTEREVVLVLDDSFEMLLADSELVHLDALEAVLFDPAQVDAAVRLGLVTTGGGYTEQTPPTTDRAALRERLGLLRAGYAGEPRGFLGLARATEKIRSKAVCPVRSFVVFVVGSRDKSPVPSFEEASLGLYSTPGDLCDDLGVFALAVGQRAFDEASQLIPEGGGTVSGVSPGSRTQAEAAAREIRDAIGGALGGGCP